VVASIAQSATSSSNLPQILKLKDMLTQMLIKRMPIKCAERMELAFFKAPLLKIFAKKKSKALKLISINTFRQFI
jgi:hypothetical protein